jgi:hypothetical protein
MQVDDLPLSKKMIFCELLRGQVYIPTFVSCIPRSGERLTCQCPLGVAQHELETASMMDCYSPYGQSATDMELSGGYKEGDGDDLPILRVNPKP